MNESSNFPEYFSKGWQCKAIFYIYSQPIELFDYFDWCKNMMEVADKVVSFIKGVQSGLVKRISSVNELQKEIKEKKILGIYLGREGKFFEDFKNFAYKHIDFSFYYTLDTNLIRDINLQNG